MEELKQSHEVEIVWRSYELRPKNGEPIPDWYRERIETTLRPQFEQMARERYGIEIHSGPFGQDSRPALIGAKYAEALGVGAAYHKAVFRAYWLEAQAIADRAVLRQIAAALGLDADEFEAALDDPTYEKQVISDIVQAQALGLNGVPALIFERKYLVSGAQPYQVLVNIVEQVRARESGGE